MRKVLQAYPAIGYMLKEKILIPAKRIPVSVINILPKENTIYFIAKNKIYENSNPEPC